MTAARVPIAVPEPVPGWALDLAAGIAALRSEVAGLRAALEHRRPRDDEAALAALLPAIAAAVEDRAFTSAEVIVHSRLAATSGLADSLRACGASTPRRLGKLLRRCEARPVGDVVVERIGQDRSGVIWRAFRGFPG